MYPARPSKPPSPINNVSSASMNACSTGWCTPLSVKDTGFIPFMENSQVYCHNASCQYSSLRRGHRPCQRRRKYTTNDHFKSLSCVRRQFHILRSRPHMRLRTPYPRKERRHSPCVVSVERARFWSVCLVPIIAASTPGTAGHTKSAMLQPQGSMLP